MNNKKLSSFARLLETEARGCLNYPVHINFTGDRAVAYVILDRQDVEKHRPMQVYINPDHELVQEDTEAKTRFAIKGLFAHELLHVCFTDPVAVYAVETIKRVPNATMYYQINNILEDAYIEYWCKTVFTRSMYAPLYYMIHKTWKQAEDIDPNSSEYIQIMNALIMFGDMGKIKGTPSDKAQAVLNEVIPLMYKGIKEHNPKKRAEISYEMYKLISPNEETDNDDVQKITERMKQMGKQHGSTIINTPALRIQPPDEGTEEGNDAESEAAQSSIAKEQQRTLKKLSNSKKKDSSPSQGNDSDSSSPSNDGTDKEEKEKAETGENGQANSQKCQDDKQSDKQGEADSQSAEMDKSQASGKTPPRVHTNDVGEYGVDDLEVENIDLDLEDDFEQDIDEAEKMLSASLNSDNSIQIGNVSLEKCEEFDTPLVTGYYHNAVVCENYRIQGINQDSYDCYMRVVREYQNEISKSTRIMKKIVAQNMEKSYRVQGKLCLGRLCMARKTASVFEKKNISDKGDACVEIVMDVSGSMDGPKMGAAKAAAICISEVMASAGIPFKVMTFSAGWNRVIHTHYVNYDTKCVEERIKLATIDAGGCNFDGYAIRAATEDMVRQKALHRLMIVMTDGAPSCTYYSNNNNITDGGISDVWNAVNEARAKKVTVFGVGIDADLNTQQKIYGQHFVPMTNLSTLLTELFELIRQEVTKW